MRAITMRRLSRGNLSRKVKEKLKMKKTWSCILPRRMGLRQRVVGRLIHHQMLTTSGKRGPNCTQHSSRSMLKMFLTYISKARTSKCNHKSKITWQVYLELASTSNRTIFISLRQKDMIKRILKAMRSDNQEAYLP